MEKIKEETTAVYKYDTMDEMMEHVATMGEAGWSLLFITSVTLHATYTKPVV